MKLVKLILMVFISSTLFGCAHPIVVSPKTEKIVSDFNYQQKISANVGFYISPEATNLEVTTPGGGGDNVRYYPYRDIEVGYQRILQNVFNNAIKLRSANDSNELSNNNIQYTLEPILITTSGSTGFFTWPPTNFTVDLTCKIRDASGKEIGNPRVVGNGQHTEGILALQGDFGLAGRRAMEDALMKMQRALLEFKYPNKISKTESTADHSINNSISQPSDQITTRLEKLKKLFDSGLISKIDYERKKKEIIDSF